MRKMFSENQVKLLALASLANVNDGTIDNVIGLDSNGNPVKGTISGGDKVYIHKILIATNDGYENYSSTIILTNKLSTLINTFDLLKSALGITGNTINNRQLTLTSQFVDFDDDTTELYFFEVINSSKIQLRKTTGAIVQHSYNMVDVLI